MVYSIGFNTFKGNLITGILYPKEMGDDFLRDSVKYIILMGILTFVGFFVSLKFLIVEGECTKKEIIEIFLDLFTTTVPPSLPTCLSIGITYSLSRLNDKGIFCIRRDRINMAGRVNILVFDKTGTLTENSMDKIEFISVKINTNKEFEFNPLIESILNDSNIVIDYFKKKGPNYKDANKDLLQYYIECLACCHHITYVNDNLVGDSIDVKMFESLDWIIKENADVIDKNHFNSQIINYVMPKNEEKTDLPTKDDNDERLNKRYEIGIVKKFFLSNALQRMTVISKNINENCFKVFCKGSP
jgi:cation-transporting ATPase 13A3/4/5